MSQSMLSQPPKAHPEAHPEALHLQLNDLLKQATDAFEQQRYPEAALLYEQLIEIEPDKLSYLWCLGLARLLTGDEAEAQMTWMMGLSAAETEAEIEMWTGELVEVLEAEAVRQEAQEHWDLAWAVRQYIREVAPTRLNNLLHLVRLATKLNLLNDQYLTELALIELLQTQSSEQLDQALVLNAAIDAVQHQITSEKNTQLLEVSLARVSNPSLILNVLTNKANELVNRDESWAIAVASYLLELSLRYAPEDIDNLKLLSSCYETDRRYQEAIDRARRYLSACKTPEDELAAIGYLCVRLLRSGLCWDEVSALFERQKRLMAEIVPNYRPDPERPLESSLLTFCSFYLHYFKDAPAEHRQIQNQLAALIQTEMRFQAKEIFESCQTHLTQRRQAPAFKAERKLKVGYMARYMLQHPVGWLARWLMQYHDKEKFEIYTYHLHMKRVSDFTDHWFVKPVTRSARFDDGCWAGIAKHICENDEIDILIDLDSITYTETCNILSLKPAPIQVSWLGYDAPGLPAVDYFIADPYVLPDHAQDYYAERIWRLPGPYLAVDGFEVGVPTLRRDQMDIPADAVVYLSAQDGRKRHPEMIRLQLQILREVPNSYLLIKGLGDEATIKQTFEEIAESEGVSRDRLRFLKRDINETAHRANLGIADVVLDTYPYNGATTTLETLWMGVPLVTKVGQQWAARNSYTMLKHVGVEAGIAWSDGEYLEWGVRLGQDAKLRQEVHLRLMQSRQTSPLWNTRQFAQQMETAYQQMWQIHTAP